MSNNEFTHDDLLEIRRNRALELNKVRYGYFCKSEQKKYKLRKDILSKDDRKRIDDLKEKVNGEHIIEDLW